MDTEEQTRSAAGRAKEDAAGRDVTTVLAEWRDAERRAAGSVPGSADEAAARADVARLRAEYQRAQRSAVKRASK